MSSLRGGGDGSTWRADDDSGIASTGCLGHRHRAPNGTRPEDRAQIRRARHQGAGLWAAICWTAEHAGAPRAAPPTRLVRQLMKHRQADSTGLPTPTAMHAGEDHVVSQHAVDQRRHQNSGKSRCRSRSAGYDARRRPRSINQERRAPSPTWRHGPGPAATIPIARLPPRGFAQSGFN